MNKLYVVGCVVLFLVAIVVSAIIGYDEGIRVGYQEQVRCTRAAGSTGLGINDPILALQQDATVFDLKLRVLTNMHEGHTARLNRLEKIMKIGAPAPIGSSQSSDDSKPLAEPELKIGLAITDFSVVNEGMAWWTASGIVSDTENPDTTGYPVRFGGVLAKYNLTCDARADGVFTITFSASDMPEGTATAVAYDMEGRHSIIVDKGTLVSQTRTEATYSHTGPKATTRLPDVD